MQIMDARENPERPVIGVGAVVMQRGEVLLIRRGKPPKEGEWSLPGGAQELGESVHDALKREVKEETGLDVKVLDFLDIIDLIDHADGGAVRYHYTLVDYLAEPTGGALRAGSDASDARFFKLEEALALPLWSETHRIITMAAHRYKKLKGQTNDR